MTTGERESSHGDFEPPLSGAADIEAGSALSLFQSEAPSPEVQSSHETASAGEEAPPETEEQSPAADDADVRKRRESGWLASWTIVVLVVIAVPLSFAATLVIAALPFVFIWLVYTGLIQPVLRTEQTLIVLNPAVRATLFAAWLFMVAAGSVALIRGWSALRGRAGFPGTDSVVLALISSVVSVLVAFGLSSWLVNWLLRLVP